jgi:prophage regulatory protein
MNDTATVKPDAPLPRHTIESAAQVLSRFPVGKTTWWAGVRSGRYPAAIQISPGRVGWRKSDIDALIDSL